MEKVYKVESPLPKGGHRAGDPKGRPSLCTCVGDGFAALPPELRLRPRKKSSLRKVTCPGCGLVYSTNRSTDLCMECEKKEKSALAK